MLLLNDVTKKQIEKSLIGILFNLDGSTTRMLEYLTNSTMNVDAFCNETLLNNELPFDVQAYFNKGKVLHRLITLCTDKEVISYNVVFANVESLKENNLLQKLYDGKMPLGKLISNSESRREILWAGYEDSEHLQSLFYPMEIPKGIYPVKKYVIYREKNIWFYICEVFDEDNIFNCYWNNIY